MPKNIQVRRAYKRMTLPVRSNVRYWSTFADLGNFPKCQVFIFYESDVVSCQRSIGYRIDLLVDLNKELWSFSSTDLK